MIDIESFSAPKKNKRNGIKKGIDWRKKGARGAQGADTWRVNHDRTNAPTTQFYDNECEFGEKIITR